MIDISQEIEKLRESNRDEMIDYGKNALINLIKALKAYDKAITNKDINELIIKYTKLFVSADKNCEVEELKYFNSTLNAHLSYDKFFELTNHGSDAAFVAGCIKSVKEFNSGKIINNLLKYFIAMCSYKGGVLSSELKLFTLLNVDR